MVISKYNGNQKSNTYNGHTPKKEKARQESAMKYIEFVIIARNTEELEMIEGILLSFGITDSVINDPRDVAQLLEKKNSYDLDKIEQFALNFSLYDDEGTEN